MTLERANKILTNPEMFKESLVEEAKKFKQNKNDKVEMSEEKAKKILDNPDMFKKELVDKAKDWKALQDAGYSAPGKDWARNFIPVNEKGGFNFNWRDAYNQINNTDVKAKDVQKLDDFRKAKMWEEDDDVNLNNIASELHFKEPREGWSDFLKSDRFPEFQKYLEDVREYQKGKALDKIWNEDSNFAVDFMLPVSKEYAKNNYENINDLSDIAGPLTADVAANVAMTGPNVLPKVGAKIASKPALSKLYSTLLAPAITETGNMIANGKSVPEGIKDIVQGGLINAGTPKALGGLGNLFKVNPLANAEQKSVQKMVNDAANKAAKVLRKEKKGWLKPITLSDGTPALSQMNKNKKLTVYTTNGNNISEADKLLYNNPIVKDMKEIPDNTPAILNKELDGNQIGDALIRGNKDKLADLNKGIKYSEKYLTELKQKAANSIAEVGDLSQLTLSEINDLGKLTRGETFTNYAIRKVNDLIEDAPTSISEYLTNAAGRPKFGMRGSSAILNTLFPDINLFQEDKKDKQLKLQELYGF